MTFNIKPCKNTDFHFRELIKLLDKELESRYGNLQKSYDQHNILEELETSVVGYVADIPVATGCFKPFNDDSIEIKRMFVKKEERRKGYSTKVLEHLESWGKQLGYHWAVLETGRAQPEAIHLYQKNGYQTIPNYGPYVNMPNSVCMKKKFE